MTKKIDIKKEKLIEQITSINSESDIDEIEKYISEIKLKNSHKDIFKGIRKTISVEELKEEQSFTKIDRKQFDKLVSDLSIEEPIEDLLSMLD